MTRLVCWALSLADALGRGRLTGYISGHEYVEHAPLVLVCARCGERSVGWYGGMR